ncbi:MAG: sulfotransferase [Acidimicrobiia bacterium]|nr:sulfotransferase [Acidimicrobiia bacterium]
MPENKVFGIGFHKTGTTTLASALRLLGYDIAGPFGVHDADIAETALPRALETAATCDGAQDNPWPILYADLDAAFPGSKFVLTVRDPDRWLRSVVNHFGGKTTPMREWIYGRGDPVGNEDLYRERYESHNDAVRTHFASRPDDLLVLSIADGEGWDELCGFLGVPVPDVPFPHANAQRERSLLRVLRRRGRRAFRRG